MSTLRSDNSIIELPFSRLPPSYKLLQCIFPALPPTSVSPAFCLANTYHHFPFLPLSYPQIPSCACPNSATPSLYISPTLSPHLTSHSHPQTRGTRSPPGTQYSESLESHASSTESLLNNISPPGRISKWFHCRGSNGTSTFNSLVNIPISKVLLLCVPMVPLLQGNQNRKGTTS
jgi:hypothetical protein